MNESSVKSYCIYTLLHRGIGIVYLTAIFPLFFQIKALIGSDGLLPAKDLLNLSYTDQGWIKSFLQFPSIFHFYPSDYTLFVLISTGCLGAIFLIFNYKPFWGALISWISFTSLTTIGGDFFIIIIDLFLSEVGFLLLFSTYYLSKHDRIPGLVDIAFKLLNFKLWFCMGVNKFYLPMNVWTEFTFFDFFFHAQPMPTPLAPIFNQSPEILKKIAIVGIFLAEIIVPFFIFGKSKWRKTAFFIFVTTSIFIQINGNYGYFNILSIVVALSILPSNHFNILKIKSIGKNSVSLLTKLIIIPYICLQIIYSIYSFQRNPPSSQNHFNFIFTNIHTENKIFNTILEPLKWIEYWRISSPYGVFKSIPFFHGEIRFSGSYDGKIWENYEFKYLPSGNTDYLGFYAPYYPRLDHLMFYETLNAQNYRWNPLNKYYNQENPWICNFVNKLFINDQEISKLLKNNPFINHLPPLFIRAEVFRLKFSDDKNKNWLEKPMDITRIYSKENICNQAIITSEEALKTTYSIDE